jgi:hypothetical protein
MGKENLMGKIVVADITSVGPGGVTIQRYTCA